jgi:hypothetical protein
VPQNVAMTDAHLVGSSMSPDTFAASLAGAVRAAGNGHCTFVYVWDVEVDFTLRDDGLDVRVAGLDKEDPDCEFRVVGNTHYYVDRRYTPQDDGSVDVVRRWATVDLTSTEETERFLVANGLASTLVGTPLGIIEGIRDDGDVVVVASDEQSTTFECRVNLYSLARAQGDLHSGRGEESEDPGVTTRFVVDPSGLPVTVEADGVGTPFTFSGWGTTPSVTPPDAPTVDWLELELAEFEGLDLD